MGRAAQKIITNGFVPRPLQAKVAAELTRFTVLVCHRRWGKTILAINLAIRAICQCRLPQPRAHYFAPARKQAKVVAWEALKLYTRPYGWEPNEAELRVDTPFGGRVTVDGAQDPDAHRGIYSDFAVLDEPAQMAPTMWSELLRPALADRLGSMLMIGTPKGRFGLFHDSYMEAPERDGWSRHMYRASDTGILLPQELDDARRDMSPAEYAQEFECDWAAAIKGAYWGAEMNKAEEQGRIGDFPALSDHLVYSAWDLGMADATAIWFFQVLGGVPVMVDYEEYRNHALPDIVKELARKPYQYGKAVVPHDIRNRSYTLAGAPTRRQVLEQLGFETVMAPELALEDGIEVARNRINITKFSAKPCKFGLECLRQFRAEYDETKQVLRTKPLKDWTSHGADAFRYFAITPLDHIVGGWGSTGNRKKGSQLWR